MAATQEKRAMSNIAAIEAKTTEFAKRREQLAQVVAELNDGIESLKRKHIGVIKKRVAAAAEAHAELKAAIDAAPHCFEKPRSVIIAGIRVGFQKGKGAIEWDNDEQVVKLIRKHFADEFDVLVKTVETPVKAALSQLAAADLKRIGVTVKDAGDEILIKPADSHVDKLVASLLKDATEEATS